VSFAFIAAAPPNRSDGGGHCRRHCMKEVMFLGQPIFVSWLPKIRTDFDEIMAQE